MTSASVAHVFVCGTPQVSLELTWEDPHSLTGPMATKSDKVYYVMLYTRLGMRREYQHPAVSAADAVSIHKYKLMIQGIGLSFLPYFATSAQLSPGHSKSWQVSSAER